MSSDASKLSATNRRDALMSARARRLAQPREAAEPPPSTSCLVCEAGLELFAIPLDRIARVVRAGHIAAIPTANPALIGIMSRGGVFHKVYDLIRLLNVGSGGEGRHVVLLRGQAGIALRVDEAIRVTDIVEAPASRETHVAVRSHGQALQASLFGQRTISVIDVRKLVSDRAPGRLEGD